MSTGVYERYKRMESAPSWCSTFRFNTDILMMYSILFAVCSVLLTGVSAFPHQAPFSTFNSTTVFVPLANYTDPQVLYARTVELEDGVLL